MSEKKHISNKYGGLFHHESYGGDSVLLREALREIADHLGHTMENPISISLLCLDLMIPHDVCQEIYFDIIKLINKESVQELEISQIKEIMAKHIPREDEFSELTVRAFVKAMAKSWLPELRPFADSLS